MISPEGPNNNNSRIIDSANIERKYFNDITIPVVSTPENGCKIFIGQIPKDLKENDLRPFLDEFGSISDISIIRERDRDTGAFISKGCAFVTFTFPEAAERAVEQLHDKVKLPHSHNALQVRIAETQVERENKIFVGMLPKTATENDLTNTFSVYGELREVHVIRGPEGGSKGCAFVKFHQREAAIAAIEDLHDSIPMGATRPLVVKFADSKKQSRSSRADEGLQLAQQFSGMSLQHPHPQQMYSSAPVGMAGGGIMGPQSPPDQRMLYPYSSQQLQYPMVPAAYNPNYSMMEAKPPQHQVYPIQQDQRFFVQQQQQQQHQQQQQQQGYSQYSRPPPSQGASQFDPSPYGMNNPAPQNGGGGGRRFPVKAAAAAAGSPSQSSVAPAAAGASGGGDSLNSSGHGPVGQQTDDGEAEADLDADNNAAANAAPSNLAGSGADPFLDPQDLLDALGQHVRPPEGPTGANLFIYHLPRDIADADLATLFAPFGNVISAKVFVDKKTSDSKGFGFVSYDVLESANLAIESMNGFQIGSKRLKVQHKRTGQGNSEHSEDMGGSAPGPYYDRGPRDSDGMGSEMRRADPNASAGSYPFRGVAQSRYVPDPKDSLHHHPQQQQQPYPYSVYPAPYAQYSNVDVLAMNRRGGGRPSEPPHGMVTLPPGQGQGPPPGMILATPAQRPGQNVSYHSVVPMSMGGYNYSPSPVPSAGYGARGAPGAGYLDGGGFSPSPGPHLGDEYSLRQNSGGRGRRGGGGDREKYHHASPGQGLGQGARGEVGRTDPRRGFNEYPDHRDGTLASPDAMMVAQQYQQGLSYHQPPPQQQQLYPPQQPYPYRGGSGPNQRSGKALPLFAVPSFNWSSLKSLACNYWKRSAPSVHVSVLLSFSFYRRACTDRRPEPDQRMLYPYSNQQLQYPMVVPTAYNPNYSMMEAKPPARHETRVLKLLS
eukprot:gene28082-36971_t